jgi:hypothetical protein
MKELANNKVDARISMLKFDLNDQKRAYNNGYWGSITMEELKEVIEGTKKELKIWEYIKSKIQ